MKDLEDICNANNLINAYNCAKKGTDWKESVQKYGINLLTNVRETQRAIREGTYTTKPLVEFELHERGHIRDIKSHHISDRVVQRSLNDNVLAPRVRPKLIYDNGASLKNKGLTFSRKRFEKDLRQAYKEFNGEVYILFIDFSKYFDNLRHSVILEQLTPLLEKEHIDFLRRCFKEYEVDVSYMSEEEYKNCMDTLFNSLEYSRIPKELKNGEKIMHKSMGIGSQTSQICGILYPHRIDNYCKIVKSIKHYGRYMDDTYIMLRSKQDLKNLLEDIRAICKELGIFINEKKTCIKSIYDWNVFLKINYKVLKNGKIIRKVHNSAIIRERKRLLKYKKLMDKGQMTFDHIYSCFKSWKGCFRKYDSGYKIYRLEKFFRELFKENFLDGRK